MGQAFVNWEGRLRNSTFALDCLSSNTYLLLISSDPYIGAFLPRKPTRETHRLGRAYAPHDEYRAVSASLGGALWRRHDSVLVSGGRVSAA